MDIRLSVDELRDQWNNQIITEGEVPLQTFEEFLVHKFSRALGLIRQLEECLAKTVHTERNQYWYKTEAGLGEEELDHMNSRLRDERALMLEALGWSVQYDEYHTNVYHYDGRCAVNGGITQKVMISK